MECDYSMQAWDDTINFDGYNSEELCSVVVDTNGTSCADFCNSQGYACAAG